MKKIIFLCFVMLLAQVVSAQQEFKLIIDGRDFSVIAGQDYGFITRNGEQVNFKVQPVNIPNVSTPVVKPQTPQSVPVNNKTFNDKFLSFEYPSQYSVAGKKLSNDIRQLTMVNGEGGGIVIQEFAKINPESSLDDFLFSLLDGQLPTGVKRKTIRVANGKKLVGKSVEDFDGTRIQVFAEGKGSQGVLIALIGNDSNKLLTKVVETFTVK